MSEPAQPVAADLQQADDGEADGTVERRLAGRRGPDLVRALIEEIVRLDRMVAVLSESVADRTMLQAFGRDLLARPLRSAEAGPLPRQMRINAEDLFEPNEGFHQIERDRDGKKFRWTGPGRQFFFDVCIDRSQPVEVELHALGLVDEARQAGLTLAVGTLALPCVLRRDGPNYRGYAVIPPDEATDLSRLTFIVAETLAPGQDDDRLLGIAFVSLNVSCQGDEAKRSLLPTQLELTAPGLPEESQSFLPAAADEEGRIRRPLRTSSFGIEAAFDRSREMLARLTLEPLRDMSPSLLVAVEIDGLTQAAPLEPAGRLVEAEFLVPPCSRDGVTRFSVTVPMLDGGSDQTPGFAFRSLSVARHTPPAPPKVRQRRRA